MSTVRAEVDPDTRGIASIRQVIQGKVVCSPIYNYPLAAGSSPEPATI